MSSPNEPQYIMSRYALFDVIARGGMASVHIGRLAGAAGFSKTVAIKRMHQNLATNPHFVEMFVDEARLAGRLQHPNVVNVFDVVARDHEAFLVMEYVHGDSLSSLMKKLWEREEQVPLEIAVQIVRDALYGLHAAHEAKDEKGLSLEIVHRDVSPQNVLVGVDGVARVLDFGIAKAVGRIQESSTGQLKGKISYMAPEQVVGHAVDRRVDVYAAGVILWEALAGQRLFEGENSAEIVYHVLEDDVPDVREFRPDVSERLSLAITRAISRKRDDRFVSAEHFAKELEDCSARLAPGQIGKFVERVSGTQLVERRARVDEIEGLDLEDLARMPSAHELASRPTNERPSEPMIEAGAGDETIVTHGITTTSTQTVTEARPPSSRFPLVLGAAVVAVVGSVFLITTRGDEEPSTAAEAPQVEEPDQGLPSAEEPKAASSQDSSNNASPSAPSEPKVDPDASDADSKSQAPPQEKTATQAAPAQTTPAAPRPKPKVRTTTKKKPSAPVKPEDLFARE